MRMETFYKIILGIREFPGCADLLLTYDDQEILHQLYNQNQIGIHIIGRNYSCRRLYSENFVKENVYDNSTADCT